MDDMRLSECQEALIHDAYLQGQKEGYLHGQHFCAAGPWETGEPPKDGTLLLILPASWNTPVVTSWNITWEHWETYGACINDKIRWSRINMPKEKRR